MDLLRKTGLNSLSIPFFNPIDWKPLKTLASAGFFFLITLFNLSPPWVFAESSPEGGAERLKTLKIEAFKRELRLPVFSSKQSSQGQELNALYRQNRFQDVLKEVEGLLLDQRDAPALIFYGNSLLLLGQQSRAVAAFQEAFQKANHAWTQSAALANFAFVFSMSQRWAEAVRWLEKALDLDRESDHWRGQGLALSQLGAFYFKLGDAEKGAAAHIEALEIAETIPIPWLEARQLSQLAVLYYRDQVFVLARDYYQKALKIYGRLDDSLSEAGTLSALSFVYKDLNDFDTALSLQLQALARYQALQDTVNLSKIWLNLSLLYRDQGLHQDALRAAEEALHLQTPLKNQKKLAEIEGTIGTIYEKKGERVKALQHLKKARAYFEATGASQEIHIVDLRIQRLEDQIP